MSTAKRLTEATYEMDASILAKHKKAFTDVGIVNDCFLPSGETVYAEEAILKHINNYNLRG